MVDGIHDYDTAILSTQFAMTGHLVMAAMLPGNALGAVRRLREMEIDDFMIGSALVGVIAQRLVRCVCPHCKKEVEIEPSLAEHLGLEKGTHVWRGQGCDQCRKSGYKGRTAVYEVLQIDKELAELISTGASIDQIEERAKVKGFKTMLDDGRQKVLEGITTPEEIIRCWLSTN
jgi:type II secretory ATPase GspE/PulE/Tfp pilus assembly ATPase PilB-like protein